MNNDLLKAAEILKDGTFTCVLCAGDAVYTSTERGVQPLLQWIADGVKLQNFSAADKVVGKAAAFLYGILGVRAVYAPVMSQSAVQTLIRCGIQPFYDIAVETIRNRSNTGSCPMEQTVQDIDDPQQALEAIRCKAQALGRAHSSAQNTERK